MKAFMNRMEQYGIPPVVDYAQPREENRAQEVVDRIRTAGIIGLARTIMTTKVDRVKRFYEAYATERGIAVDVFHKIEETRAESARAARSDVDDSILEEVNQLEPDEPMSASPTGEASA